MSKLYMVYIFLLWCCISNADIHYIAQQDLHGDTFIIAESGLWCLTESIVTEAHIAFIIAASGVTLDLQGYTISGNTVSEKGIVIQESFCIIKNGSLTHFSTVACEMNGAQSAVLDTVHISDSKHGLLVVDSDSARVLVCTIDACESAGCLIIGESPYMHIESAKITNVGGIGLQVNASYCTCSNVLTESNVNGVVINATNVELHNVQSMRNKGSGFSIVGSDITMGSCVAVFNEGDGLVLNQGSANVRIISGTYAHNKGIGINNLGDTTNSAYAVLLYQNQGKDAYRILLRAS